MKGIYFITQGSVEIKHSQDKRVAVLVYKSGSYFGDHSLLNLSYHRQYM